MPRQIKHNLSAAQRTALRSALTLLESACSPGGPLAPTLEALRTQPPDKRAVTLAACPNLARLVELGRKLTL